MPTHRTGRCWISLAVILALLAGIQLQIAAGGSSEVPPVVEATSAVGITDIAWHPTEEILAIASETGLHLFDGDLQVILSVDTDTSFSSLDWSADGTQLAAGDWAQAEVRIYDFQPSQPALTRTRTLTEDAAYAMKVTWSSNGSYFAALFELRLDQTNAADPYGVVYTYDTSTWEHLTEDPFPIVIPSPVLSWNPDLDSTILLTAFQNAYFTFDAATLDVTWSVSYTIPSLSAAWITEDTVAALVAGSFDLRDVENDQLLANLEWGGVTSGANEIATDAEGTYVFTGSAIVEIATGVVLREYEVSHANYADWHPTSDLIAAVNYERLAILDATNLQPSSQPTFTPFPSLTPRPTRTASPGPTATATPDTVSGGSSEVPPVVVETNAFEVYDIAWHPTEEVLAVASHTGLHVFDGDLQVILSVDTDTSFSSLDWSADGTQLAAGHYQQPEVRIYDFQPSQPALTRTRTLTEDADYAMKVAWSSDSSYFAALFELRRDQYRAPDPYGQVYAYNTSSWEHLTEDPTVVVAPLPVLSWNPDLNSTVLLVGSASGFFCL